SSNDDNSEKRKAVHSEMISSGPDRCSRGFTIAGTPTAIELSGNVAQQNCVGANDDIITDGNCTEQFSSGANVDVVPNARRTVLVAAEVIEHRGPLRRERRRPSVEPSQVFKGLLLGSQSVRAAERKALRNYARPTENAP